MVRDVDALDNQGREQAMEALRQVSERANDARYRTIEVLYLFNAKLFLTDGGVLSSTIAADKPPNHCVVGLTFVLRNAIRYFIRPWGGLTVYRVSLSIFFSKHHFFLGG